MRDFLSHHRSYGLALGLLLLSGCFYREHYDNPLLSNESVLLLRYGMKQKEVAAVIGETPPHRSSKREIPSIYLVFTIKHYQGNGVDAVLIFENDVLTTVLMDDEYISLPFV